MANVECTICCNKVPTHKIPRVQGHGHTSFTVCAKCIVNHASEEIRGKIGVTRVGCLQSGCKQDISASDLKAAGLSSEMLDLLDKRQRDAFIASLPNFRWCTRPGCGNGYELLDPQAHNIMLCKCGHKTCANHKVPFHEGQTCMEYDLQLSQARAENKSEHWINVNCKRCPRCKTPIEVKTLVSTSDTRDMIPISTIAR
jgi:hypothetical protein